VDLALTSLLAQALLNRLYKPANGNGLFTCEELHRAQLINIIFTIKCKLKS